MQLLANNAVVQQPMNQPQKKCIIYLLNIKVTMTTIDNGQRKLNENTSLHTCMDSKHSTPLLIVDKKYRQTISLTTAALTLLWTNNNYWIIISQSQRKLYCNINRRVEKIQSILRCARQITILRGQTLGENLLHRTVTRITAQNHIHFITWEIHSSIINYKTLLQHRDIINKTRNSYTFN